MFRKKIWKIVIATVMMLSVMIAMTACGTVEVTVYNMDETDVAKAILDDVEFGAQLYQVKENKISDFISSDECEKRIMFMGNGTQADSFGIFTVPQDEADYDTLGDEMFEKVQTYLTELGEAYKSYFPAETAKVELAYVAHFGKYVVFCVTADYEKAQQVVEAMVQSTVVEMDKKALEAGTKPSDIATFTSTKPDVVLDNYPSIVNDGAYVDRGTVFSIGDCGFEAYSFVESTADKYVETMNNIAAKLKGTVNLYDVLIPLGSGIVLPDSYYEKVKSSNQADALNYISSKLDKDVNAVNPYVALMSHRNEYIYYRTDHHWTQLGAYYAYEELCKKMDVLPISLDSHEKGTFSGFLGTFYNDLGSPKNMKENPDDLNVFYPISKNSELTYFVDEKTSYKWKIINDVSDYPAGIKYSAFIAGDNPYTEIFNDDLVDGSSVIVVKESFGNSLVPFLVDHYQKIYVVDYRYWSGDLLELAKKVKADDVIFLNNLSMTRNGYLVGKIAQLIE